MPPRCEWIKCGAQYGSPHEIARYCWDDCEGAGNISKQNPLAVVHVAHGLAEGGENYEDLGQFLNK
jgi:hypothetical protein